MFWEIEHLMEQNRAFTDGADGRFASIRNFCKKQCFGKKPFARSASFSSRYFVTMPLPALQPTWLHCGQDMQ